MRVMIVDDHTIVREGLKSLIVNDLMLDVVGDAKNGLDAIKLAEQLMPELIIMDVAMPEMDGIHATAIIKERLPQTKILILSMHAGNSYVRKALKAGAAAFILKDSAFEELAEAIGSLQKNKRFLSPSLFEGIVDDYLELIESEEVVSVYDNLTAREKEVFHMTTRGYNREKIAEQLNVSPRTIDQHRKNIRDKLNVQTQEELISLARTLGL